MWAERTKLSEFSLSQLRRQLPRQRELRNLGTLAKDTISHGPLGTAVPARRQVIRRFSPTGLYCQINTGNGLVALFCNKPI